MTDHAVYHPGSPPDQRPVCEVCEYKDGEMRPAEGGVREVIVMEREDGKEMCQECYEIYGC